MEKAQRDNTQQTEQQEVEYPNQAGFQNPRVNKETGLPQGMPERQEQGQEQQGDQQRQDRKDEQELEEQ